MGEEKFNAKKLQMNERQLENFKANIILNFYPEVLHTPQIQMEDKTPKREDINTRSPRFLGYASTLMEKD